MTRCVQNANLASAESQDQLESQQRKFNGNLFGGSSPPFQGGVAATIKQNVAKPPCLGADGVVMNESRSAPFGFVELDNHPACAAKEREHFLDGAATPPWKGGESSLPPQILSWTLRVYDRAFLSNRQIRAVIDRAHNAAKITHLT
jgi:hypothetical protein